jgi:transketolase N-terminal domain/subunit
MMAGSRSCQQALRMMRRFLSAARLRWTVMVVEQKVVVVIPVLQWRIFQRLLLLSRGHASSSFYAALPPLQPPQPW